MTKTTTMIIAGRQKRKTAPENMEEPPTRENMMIPKTPRSTRTRTTPITAACGGRLGPLARYDPRGGGCGGWAGGGCGWATFPD
jgi:hypothetical protein